MTDFICANNHRWTIGLNSNTLTQCPTCGLAGTPIAQALSQESLILTDVAMPPKADQQPTANYNSSVKIDSPRTVHVPGYEILGELGRGGMGVVYKARHLVLDRLVALKMILAGDHAGEADRKRFRAEAAAVAALQHAGIVQIFEIGEHDSRPYLALEFIEGGSLAAHLAGTPWPGKESARLMETIARTMHYAHERGIVHRDLKPANILLAGVADPSTLLIRNPLRNPNAARLTPKVSDFGLAKRIDTNEGEIVDHRTPTRTGAVVGTPSYIAPEQAAGKHREVGPLSDVYSLGAILYEMLTGRPPFRGETPLDTVLQVLRQDPVPPTRLQPKVPRDLEIICLTCLHKDPNKRYPSAAELADDLRRFLNGETIKAKATTSFERLVKWARRRPTTAVTIGLLILVFAGIFSLTLWMNLQLSQAAAREQQEASRARQQQLEAEEQKKIAEQKSREAESARQNAESQRLIAEQKSREAEEQVRIATRSLYALQLAQVSALVERDPRRAADLLDDPRRCPPNMRDFTWHYLQRLSQRERRPPLLGHDEAVSALAYSPDGKLLASSGWDQTIRFWDARTGLPIAWARGTKGHLLALTFSPDGKWLLAGNDEGKLLLTNLPPSPNAKGQPSVWPIRYTTDAGRAPVSAVAFAPDGKSIACGLRDGTLRFWMFQPDQSVPLSPTGEIPRVHARGVFALSFSPDGEILATGGSDRTVRLWDTESRQLRHALNGHTDSVVSLTFSPDGRYLASGGDRQDQSWRLWNVLEGKERMRRKGHTEAVYSLAFSPEGELLATGSGDGTVRLWETDTGNERAVFRGHSAPVFAVAFSPDSQTLASGGSDKRIHLWTTHARRSDSAQLAGAPLQLAAFSANGEYAVTFSAEAGVVVWELTKLAETPPMRPIRPRRDEPIASSIGQPAIRAVLPGAGVRAVGLSPDGQLLAISDVQANVYLWNLRPLPSGKAVILGLKDRRRLEGKFAGIGVLTFGPLGRSLVTGSDDGTIRQWELPSGKLTATLSGHTKPIRAMTFNRDGTMLASSSSDRYLRLWNLTSKQSISNQLTEHRLGPAALSFSADGTLLAAGGDEGGVSLWNVQPEMGLTFARTMSGHGEGIQGLVFTPARASGNRLLVTVSRDRSLKLWDALTGQERALLSGHTDSISTVAFSPRGDFLLSLDRDGQLRIWRAGSDNGHP